MATKQLFLVSPDYNPSDTLDWYLINGALQKYLKRSIHLLLSSGNHHYHTALEQGKPDIVYASSFDAASLIREHGYRPIARPQNHSDEVIIFSNRESGIDHISKVSADLNVASISEKDVEQIALRLLEAANVSRMSMKSWETYDYFQTVLRAVRNDSKTIGVLRADIFGQLSSTVKSWYTPVIESKLYELTHTLLIRGDDPKLTEAMRVAIPKISQDPAMQGVFKALNMPQGFTLMSREDGLFMADIIDTIL